MQRLLAELINYMREADEKRMQLIKDLRNMDCRREQELRKHEDEREQRLQLFEKKKLKELRQQAEQEVEQRRAHELNMMTLICDAIAKR